MRRGFTLIELLVVIAIIAILSAILFPVFAKAREKARTASCQSNLKQYALAIMMYFDDYDDYGPFYACGAPVPKRLEGGRCPEGINSTGSCGIYSCPSRGNYSLPYYRGGNCHAGPTSINTPWSRDSHPLGFKVIHPASVMLVGDARAGHQWINTPEWFYDLDGNGMMTPRHGSLNNMAFCDGHVKGYTPGWLKAEVEAGAADADGDGKADGWVTGRGAWWFWYF